MMFKKFALWGSKKKAYQEVLEDRTNTIYKNFDFIPKESRELIVSHAIEQANHCLDRLHSNEASLESRISNFFSITAGAFSALVGIIIFHESENPLLSSQFKAAACGGVILLLATLILLRAMQPRGNYQMKGCTPYAILSVKELIQQKPRLFTKSILETLELRIAIVERQNKWLASHLKYSTLLIVAAPVIAVLIFLALS